MDLSGRVYCPRTGKGSNGKLEKIVKSIAFFIYLCYANDND